MKKIFIIAGMLSAGVFYAQQDGSVGVNAQPSGATLDVQISADAVKTEGQGIAVPRVTKQQLSEMTGTIAEGALVYVNTIGTATGTATARIAEVTDANGVGFYYFDKTKWVKVGGGAVASTPSAVPYENIRGKVTFTNNEKNYTVKADDYFIFTNNDGNTTINFPATSDSEKGRVVYIFNGNSVSGGLTLNGLTAGQTGHNQYRGRVFMSTGKGWYSVGL